MLEQVVNNQLYRLISKFTQGDQISAAQALEAEKIVNKIAEEDEDNTAAQLAKEILELPFEDVNQEDFSMLVGLLSEISHAQEFTLPLFDEPAFDDVVEYDDPESNPDRQRIIRINDDGSYEEVDQNGEFVGPLDSLYMPAEGHPEYEEVSASFIDDMSDGPLLPPVMESHSKGMEVAAAEPLFQKAIDAGLVQDEKSVSKTPLRQDNIYLDTDIGTLLYQPIAVVQRRRCVALYFDVVSGTPPLFIPREGYTCMMREDNGVSLKVMYTGSKFKDPFRPELTIMVFTVLD